MKYAKLTVVMRDETQSKVLGIVNLENMGGQSKVSCGLRIPKFDYLQFTFNNGKVYFLKISPTETAKVDFECSEYSCSCVKNGNVLAKGHTSRFAYPNPQLIKYMNEYVRDEKNFFAEVSSDLDAFEGKVATYNYYENELPKDVAKDAEKIVETVMLRNKNNENRLSDNEKENAKTSAVEKNCGKKEDCSYEKENCHSGRLEPQRCPMDTACPNYERPLTDYIEPQKCPMDTACPNYERPLTDYIEPQRCPMDTACPPYDIPMQKRPMFGEIPMEVPAMFGKPPMENCPINGEVPMNGFYPYNECPTRHESPLCQKPSTYFEPQRCPMDTVCSEMGGAEHDMTAYHEGHHHHENHNHNDAVIPDMNKPQIEEKPAPAMPKYDFKDQTKKNNDEKADFYFEIKEQLDHLFETFKEDAYLNEIIPSSKWVKVTYDESGKSYSVGLLTDSEEVVFIGYGVEGTYASTPPKELNKNAQWVPLDFAKPQEKGYWMIYQSAKDGQNL